MRLTSVHKLILGFVSGNLAALIRLEPGLIHRRDAYGITPLHWAIERGTINAIILLLESGADVNATDYDGMDALTRAGFRGSYEMCELLLTWGAITVDLKGRCNALHSLPYRRDGIENLISLLVQHGMDVNGPDIDGRTPLIRAASKDASADSCERLIELGADIVAVDRSGMNALHFSILHDAIPAASVLIKHGVTLTRPQNISRLITLDAIALGASVDLMEHLEKSFNEPLHVDPFDVDMAWWSFDKRDFYYAGRRRRSYEVERQAFESLLSNLVRVDQTSPQDREVELHIPGSFVVEVESDHSDEEADKSEEEGEEVQACESEEQDE
jgi:hypothetical protein